MPPKLEACSPKTPTFKSSSIVLFTLYVPPEIGFKSPPLPTTASNLVRFISFSLRAFKITSFLKSY